MPCFEVANACMLNIYGTAAACVWLCMLCLCSFAGVRPVLTQSVQDAHRQRSTGTTYTATHMLLPYTLSIQALATSKQGKKTP